MVVERPIDEHKHEIWCELRDRATLLVNAWDIIPRLPSSKAWVFDILTSAKVIGAPVGFGVKVGIPGAAGAVRRSLMAAWGLLSIYGVCGTLVFIDEAAPGKVMCVSDDESQSILWKIPPFPGHFVIAQHSIFRYEALTALLPVCSMAASIEV